VKQEMVSGNASAVLGHMQVCTLLQTDNHASTPPLCFLQARCPSCRPTNSVKALKAQINEKPPMQISQIFINSFETDHLWPSHGTK